MAEFKTNPVDSLQHLRERVERLILGRSAQRRPTDTENQLPLDFSKVYESGARNSPKTCLGDFLGVMTAALPAGDVYLFGGVLRDLALFGKRGFRSDIDFVVEGDWENCVPFLESLGAVRNKFGGFRLEVGGWSVDMWRARDTWAIAQGLVPYGGISSLIKTTILNWDAILMNWRTRAFIVPQDYVDSIKSRTLDLVLERNPNPLGMAVRVFRHLAAKDAKKVSGAAATYLANCTTRYGFAEIRRSEIRSYGSAEISPTLYRFFELIKDHEHLDAPSRYKAATEKLLKEEGVALHEQTGWEFDEYPAGTS